MTYTQYINSFISRLSQHYSESECRWLVRIILEHYKGWSRTDMLLNGDKAIDDSLITKIDTVIDRLMKDEPIQYILGETYWHGMTLKVSPAVLIPREETSELVDIIESDYNQPDLDILDICTGSGCIAIALAKDLPFAKVVATDISTDALKIAGVNALQQKVKVNFMVDDALKSSDLKHKSFDIIVSNPPYITKSESKSMDANVLDFEPHTALFVNDDTPLLFYKSISANSLRLLRPNGRLYLEINPMFCSDLCDMLEKDGWRDVEVIKDIHGKNRFIKTYAPE